MGNLPYYKDKHPFAPIRSSALTPRNSMNPTVEISQIDNVRVEDDRTGLSIETLKRAIADNLFYIQGKFPAIATKNDFYMAVAYTVRDRWCIDG